jgi:CheY-like chemotaxis protein
VLEGVRVLVVDDQQDARELMRTILTQAHAQVTTVGSVREAMAIIGSTKPHVLISDISMPEEDGYALIRQVRALPREQGGQIPAIALTAYAKTEDHRRAMEAGFQVHLAKPVEAAYITRLVAQLGGQANQMPPSAPTPGHSFPQTPPDADAAEDAHWIVDTEEASGPARSH